MRFGLMWILLCERSCKKCISADDILTRRRSLNPKPIACVGRGTEWGGVSGKRPQSRGARLAPRSLPQRGQAGLLADLSPSGPSPVGFVQLLLLCAWLLSCRMSVCGPSHGAPT